MEIFHELLEVDTDSFREGIGEASDHKAAKENDPAPAAIWGLHRSWELPFLWVSSPHCLAWVGKGRPGGGRVTRGDSKRSADSAREKHSRQTFTTRSPSMSSVYSPHVPFPATRDHTWKMGEG